MLALSFRNSNRKGTQKTKGRILAVLLIALVAFVVWHRTLELTFLGEGAIYLTQPYNTFLDKATVAPIIFRYDVFSIVFFHWVEDLFGTRYVYYMLFQLIGITFVAFAVYIISYKEKPGAGALLASLILVSSFVGSFEAIGQGYYQWYIQRIPNLVPMLAAFYLYQSAVKDGRLANKHRYLLSIALFTLAMLMAHYSFLLLPLFVFYSASFLLSTQPTKHIVRLLDCIPYVVIAAYIISREELIAREDSFITFVLRQGIMLPDVFRKVTMLTFPPDLVLYVASIARAAGMNLRLTAQSAVELFIVPTIILHILSLTILRHAPIQARRFSLAMLASLLSIVLFSFYLKQPFIAEYTTSRYLYVPSIVFALYWATPLSIVWNKWRRVRLVAVTFIALLIIANYQVIQHAFGERKELHETMRVTTRFLEKNAHNYPNTLIVLPRTIGSYSAQMLDEYYAQPGANFADADSTLYEKLLANGEYEQALVLEYKNGSLQWREVPFDVLK